MTNYLQRFTFMGCLLFTVLYATAQTTDVYTSSTTWTVPAGVSSVSIKVYGGGGGTGGQDCGAGCSNAAAGNVGYVVASFTVAAGNTIGIYPGGKGTNGTSSTAGAGGGAGGVASYGAAYNGGTGGNAGVSGTSGGGGGGGAASVVTINSVISIVAGGAGGGGGMANVANSGLPGTTTYVPNGTSNTGGNGTMPAGDGGGGGGGGGGQYGSLGGTVYATGGESAGNGGNIGGNLISGATSTASNTNITWTLGGQIEITYLSTLPVSWLDFNLSLPSAGSVLLNWSTALEIDTKEFVVQRSANANNWTNIGTVAASGNSNTIVKYSFTDANASTGAYYYRIALHDLDGKISFSNVLTSRSITSGLVKLSPNPVRGGSATLSLKNASTIVLYNSNGVKLMEKYFPAGNSLLNVARYPKGTYFLKTNEARIAFVIQ